MADRKISDLTEMPASGVASSDLFLIIDIDNPDINDRSQKFTASGLMDYIYQRLSIEGQDQRFYTDVTNSTQRGFFGTVGLNTISGNTISGGTVVNIASGVKLNFSNFQNQNLIKQDTSAPTDSGVIFWYRPPVSGLLGRTYYRYINPTGVGPSAIEWVEASPFEATTIEIGTQQVISGIFNPLRIPAATNSPSGYGGIRFVDVEGQFLSASGEYTYLPVVTSGYVGGIPAISGVSEGLPLVKYNDTVIYATLSGSAIDTDFSSSQVRFARGTQAAPSITFTGDINTGLYSPAADQVGITVSGYEHFRVERNTVTISGALNVNNGTLTTEQDIIINGIEVGRGGGSLATNTRIGDVALTANTTGAANTAVGKDSLAFNQGGFENTAVGYQSLFSNVAGAASSAFGAYALYSASNVNGNTAVGHSALYDDVSGDGNTAIGSSALANTLTSNNTAVGYEAGLNNISGVSNTLIGYRAGRDLTTGDNNTIIGRATGAAGLNNTIIISAGTAEKIKIDSSSNVFLDGTLKTISGGTGSVPIYTTSGDPDTGIFFPSPNTAGITVSGQGRVAIDINRTTVSGTFYADTISGTTYSATLGSITAPTYSFSGDLNTGIYSPAADRVGVTVSGQGRIAVDINRTTVSGTFYADTISGTTYAAALGSIVSPTYSFSGDLNTGIYSPAADRVGVTVSGQGRIAVDINRTTVSGTFYADTISGAVITAGMGTAGVPGFSFSGDLNTGIFSPGTDVIGFSASGLNIMEVRSSGVFISGLIYEAPTGVNYYPVVTQLDVGTDDNQIPLNGYLGSMAYQDEDDIAVGTGTFEFISVSGINVIETLSGTRFVATSGTAATPVFTFSGDLDTGLFSPSANTAAISVSGLGRIAVDINRTTVSGTFYADTISGTTYAATLGLITAPTYSFSGDLNTGIYSPAADRVGITVSGLGRVAVDINRTTVSGTFYADTISGTTYAATLGSITAPTYSFSGDLNTGIYSPAADRVGITVSGLGRVAVDINRTTVSGTFYADTVSGGVVTAGMGTAGAPGFSFSGDLNTGVFSPSADTIAFSSSGLNIMEVRSSGVFISGLIYEAPTGVNYFPVVTQQDIGTAPNQIPVNAYLGTMAFQDAEAINVDIATFESITTSGINVLDSVSGTRFVAVSGTAAAPSFTFSGDLDTGIYSPSSNQVAIAVSGLQYVKVAREEVTISGNTFINNGVLETESDAVINFTDIGRGGGGFSSNTRVGNAALASNDSGTNNTAIGNAALSSNQGGGSNTSAGFNSLYSNVNGGDNCAFGSYALYAASNSNGNVGIGYAALYDLIDAFSNTAVGTSALANTLTSNNTAVGYEAGLNNISGIRNVCIGDQAGRSLTTGNNNTIIGCATGAAGISDTVIIAAGTAEKIKVDSTNNFFLTGTIKTISGGSANIPIYTTSGDPDTGIFFPAGNTIGVSASGLGRVAVDINRTTISGTFYADTISGTTYAATLGSITAPTYSFSGDLNTGIYSPAADRVGITVSGLGRVSVDINRTTVSGTFYADTVSGTTYSATLGSITAPTYSFSGDLNTGIYSPAADRVGITVSGLGRLAVDINRTTVSGAFYADTVSGNVVTAGLGTAGAPGFSFSGDLNTGIFSPSADTMAFSSSGLNIMEVRSSGIFISGLIYEAPTGVNYYPVVTQLDIGTDDNQVPLNGYLGSMAYQDEDDIVVGIGTFEYITASGITTYETVSGYRFVAGSGTASLPVFTFSGDLDTGIYSPAANQISVSISGIDRVRFDTVGNLKIGGTADRATTPGTNQLVIYDGTAPVGTLANGVSLYSTTGECRVMDAAGNATLISPHDENGYWVFDSTDTRNNRRLLVHMEKLAKFIDNQFGTNFVEEIGGPPVPD